MWHVWGRRECIQDFVRKYERKKPLVRSSGRWKLSIKCIVNRMGRHALDFSWLKVGTSAAVWRTRLGTFRFHKKQRFYLLAEELLKKDFTAWCQLIAKSAT